ncbi:DNA/RNA helicase domain-containing protein [Chryseobacterium sp. MYb264]|uniref:DNA/RNA helicase domain-containing protein n=1 Tax=Chryseobacterium sp. MYb264 TaxID=2745153 RepID=UPI002E127E86|nr:DNA/RNA helicase domain-containing protein [Chryseobacterium sp. MYb264]
MSFSIQQYPFDNNLESEIIENHHQFLNWPLVYFLEENTTKEAYVGETTDVLNRLKTHSKIEKKQRLGTVNLILSDKFNKSATLDIESNLIKYISADGMYSLQNGNLGISNHQFYQKKEVYWEQFKDIWTELRSLGIARHSLDDIDNSDLFKYSPYKSLSREQISGLKMILQCLLDDQAKVSLIEGGAGTGKSILAIFLFKLLKTDISDFNYSDFDEKDGELFKILERVKAKYGDLNIALVIPMASFRKTISNVFKNIKGLSQKMVIGPSEITKQKYDLLIVDEGHRLRRRVNLGSYFGTFDKNSELLGLDKMTTSELDWVQIQSEKSIIFYDQFQSIKPSDVTRDRFYALKQLTSTRNDKLSTQFRVKGGNQYVKLIHQMFDKPSFIRQQQHNIGFYDLKLFDDLNEMVKQIHLKEKKIGLSRMVAGFAWEWISKNDKSRFDIVIDDTSLQWNSIVTDWVNSPNAINEVGCIHTTQGYDLNYTGVIIGPELDYDFRTNELIVYKENYKDKNGKNSIKDPKVLLDYVINIYKTILLRGIEGTYIYVCNPNLRKYFSQIIPLFGNSKNETKVHTIVDTPNEFTVPYYDLEIAAGQFSDLQSVEEVKYIELQNITDHADYFVCKVVGESMNKVIPNESLCLFRKYSGGSRNGLITLVEGSEIFDSETGANYTIKEYSSKKVTDDEGWHHEEITLKPLSTKPFESIVLRDEETMTFKVIGVFEKVLYV